MVKEIYNHLSVKDLPKSMEFFRKVGFTFDLQFSNEQAACMVIGQNIFAILLTEPFFKSFTTKQICDTSQSTEVLIILMVESRAEVDQILENTLSAGGKEHREKQDLGFMYSRSFEDIDGHIWEIGYMENEGKA